MFLAAVLGTLLIVAVTVAYFYRAELLEKTKDYFVATVNTETCLQALDTQNAKYKALQIDYKARKAKVRIITRVEIEERLKVIYRDRNITMKECNETARTIDAIRFSGF